MTTRTITAEGAAAIEAAEAEYRATMRAAKDVHNAARAAGLEAEDDLAVEQAFVLLVGTDQMAQEKQRAAIQAAWEQYGEDADD